MLEAEGEFPKDTDRPVIKESELVSVGDTGGSQDIVETKIGEFTVEGHPQLATVSQISVIEESEILISRPMERVSKIENDKLNDWEIVEEEESDTELPKYTADIVRGHIEKSKNIEELEPNECKVTPEAEKEHHKEGENADSTVCRFFIRR